MLLFLPPLIYFIFEYSERSLSDWLESDLDSDVQLLESINSGSFPDSHVGRYLHSLSDRFRGEVVADMLCYLRLHVELAMRAKGSCCCGRAASTSRRSTTTSARSCRSCVISSAASARPGNSPEAVAHGDQQGPVAAAVARALTIARTRSRPSVQLPTERARRASTARRAQ